MSFEEKSFYQYSLLDDGVDGKKKWQKEKVVYFCNTHRFAKETDCIEVFVKRSKTIVKRCVYCEREKRENKKVQIEDWKHHKENLTDYYVRRMLVMHTKNPLPMHEYPQDLVDAKKAILMLKREIQRAKEPLKKCFQHGDLYIDDVIKSGKHKSGKQAYKCKACMKELHARHYELNKLKVSEAQKVYRKNNKERVAQIKRASYLKHQYKYKDKDRERNRLWDKKITEELGDRYIKKLLVKRNTLSEKDTPDTLIEAMRAIQQLKRGLKEMKTYKKIKGDTKDGE